jgi:hypothetical protein
MLMRGEPPVTQFAAELHEYVNDKPATVPI